MFSKQALVFLATSLGPLAALSAQCVDEEVQKLAGGLAGDQFGIPAVDGSHALIGAPGDDTAALDGGALYAFHHDGTSWVFDQKILGSNIQIGDLLGVRIAIDGDVAIAGGSAEGTGRPGKAWIWRRAGDLWKEEARLDSPGGEADDLFGSSVAVEGDRVVVGATQATGRVTGSGAAWVYRKNGTWQVEQKLVTNDDQPGDLLGYGVAIVTPTIVVGAGGDDNSGGAHAGSARVFRFDGSVWQHVQTLVASDGAAGDEFGYVAMNGNVIVVGAVEADVGGASDVGAAYVFRFDGTSFVQVQKLVASDGAAGDYGGAVAIAGGSIVMGAAESDAKGNDSGAAYVFHHDGTRWLEVEKLVASDGGAGDGLGFPVAIKGPHILAASSGTPPGKGAAYAFRDDGLALCANQDVYVNGDSVLLTTCGGLAGAPVVLAIVSPQFYLIPYVGHFDANGHWTVQATVDSGWPRLKFGLEAFGYRKPSKVDVSDVVSIEIR